MPVAEPVNGPGAQMPPLTTPLSGVKIAADAGPCVFPPAGRVGRDATSLCRTPSARRPVGLTLAAGNTPAIFRPENVTALNLLPKLIRKGISGVI